jgi:hypothetical protein
MLYLSSIAENVLTRGTTLKVVVPLLLVVVELQLVDAKLVELLELVDDELVLLDVEDELLLLEVELVFEVLEVEEETEERLVELGVLIEIVLLEVVEELDFGAVRITYAPAPATTTTTMRTTARARGAIPPLF